MALNAVYFAVLYLYSVIHGLVAEQGADCRLIPTQKEISSEFRLKASEKGVRMVYLNLKIGNDSYHPLELEDELLPDRWVWASSIKEHMLSLPENYVVLSLGLLTHQVRSINVPLEDKPKGCVAGLNSSRQNMAIGKMLLENVTVETENSGDLQLHKTQVVCVAMIENVTVDEYQCCSMSRDRPNQVLCDQTVGSRNWLFHVILYVIAFFLTFYIPAFPLAMPDSIFNLQHECDKQDRHTEEINSDPQADHLHPMRNGYVEIDQDDEEDGEIPVDDASPITISTFWFGFVRRMPDLWWSFNLKLALMLFCVYLYFFTLSWVNEKHICNEASRKKIGEGTFPSSLIRKIIVACFYCTAFVLVLLLRPKDLLSQMTERRCITCRVALNVCRRVGEAEFILPVAGECLLGDNIRFHLKILQHMLYVSLSFFTKLYFSCLNRIFNLSMCSVKMNSLKVSRLRSSLCILWVLVAFLPTLLVAFMFGVVCIFLYLVLFFFIVYMCSPFGTLTWAFGDIIIRRLNQVHFLSRKAKHFVITILAMYCCTLLVTINNTVLASCRFITSTVAYTIMGFTLNADIITPYAAFFLVVVTNIYFCYANLQNRYKEVKGMISECLKQLHVNRRGPQTKDTIPTKLFWFVCRRVLPVESEMCRMLRNVSLILTFLFLVVYSIIFFGNEYNVSAIFSVIAVVVTGVIPELLLKVITEGKPFKGWEKVNMNTKIDSAVKDFYQEITGENTNDTENLQTRNLEQV